MKMSFYDWCIENNRKDLLDRWDYELNDKTPDQIGFRVDTYYYLKCPKGRHESQLYNIGHITRYKGLANCKYCESFGEWCMENNKYEYIDRWDYKLNRCSPYDISRSSKQKCYFKCDKHISHRSTSLLIRDIVYDNAQLYCKDCRSFAQYIIDNFCEEYLNKIWNFDLNTNSPWDIMKNSRTHVYVNCPSVEYHIGYEIKPGSIRQNHIPCPYCSGAKIHPNDSFAAINIKKYGEDFLDKYWDYEKNIISPWEIGPYSSKKIWIKCQKVDYHPSSLVYAFGFTSEKSNCSYCAKQKVHKFDSLGYLYPEVINLWSCKNQLSPYDVAPYSGSDAWFKCPDGEHPDFMRRISSSTEMGFRCPMCSIESKKSILQKKVEKYIHENYIYVLKHEYECSIIPHNPHTGCKLPYDNDLFIDENTHLIIEVHGIQHYEVSYFTECRSKVSNITPEETLAYQQWCDEYKYQYALKHGYNYLIIPYTAEKNELYKQLINSKISEILQNKTK